MELFLKDHDIFLVLLLDDFHCVYSAEESKGKPVIAELFHLLDKNMGRIHCIVCGSSSILRHLAFSKNRGHLSEHPSYGNIDLNTLNCSITGYILCARLVILELIAKRLKCHQMGILLTDTLILVADLVS
jgi:hypothetical protein